jgi:pimeloyl-ACP methyl ester carboxylesterase
MNTFVLVHGSFAGGWIWQKVAPLLRASGNDVYTPTLTGLSDRSHLLESSINLTTHITDIVNVIFYEDLKDVILVGNSYAGMVITGVSTAVPEKIRKLVYLDAYLPEDGQCELDLWPPQIRSQIKSDEAAQKGFREAPPPEFFEITDPEMAGWIKARFTPHPLNTYYQPVPPSTPESKAISRVYIHCVGSPKSTSPIFAPFAVKAKENGWPVYEMKTGHLVMLTMHKELALLLLNLTKDLL